MEVNKTKMNDSKNIIPKEAMVVGSSTLGFAALLDYGVATITKIGLGITTQHLLQGSGIFLSTFCISYGIVNLTDYIARYKRQKFSLKSNFEPICQAKRTATINNKSEHKQKSLIKNSHETRKK